MKELNFKYYPARLLLFLTMLLLVGSHFFSQAIKGHFKMDDYWWWPLGYSAILALIFTLINSYLLWKPYMKLLGLTDLRGKYKGQLISSFHVDDDTSKPNITMYIELTISQNLNGLFVKGKVAPLDQKDQETSSFKSEWVQLTNKEDGTFLLEYKYSTKVNKLHNQTKNYKSESHEGFAFLTYNLKDKTLKGGYFTHEHQSIGKLELHYRGK